MPIHDWTRVGANRFHHVHQYWTAAICVYLNSGGLPPGYFALLEKKTYGKKSSGYPSKANRVAVHHPENVHVALVEIVSPGNKDSLEAIDAFAQNLVEFLHAGVHLLIIDLFPPGIHNPQGLHQVIWSRLGHDSASQPFEKPLTLASYAVGNEIAAYVDPVAVGDALPDMPLFLREDSYVSCPLQATYEMAWKEIPGEPC